MFEKMWQGALIAFAFMCSVQESYAEKLQFRGYFEVEQMATPKIEMTRRGAGVAAIVKMERGEKTWGVTYTESPVPSGPDIYTGYAEDIAAAFQGTVERTGFVEVQGNRCLEYALVYRDQDMRDQRMAGRVCAVGNRLYDVAFEGPKETSDEEIQPFLESFRILN